jgi:hypothetical protein
VSYMMIINRKANRKIARVKPISSLGMVLVIGTVLGISLMWGTIGLPSVFAQELGEEAGNATYGNVTDGNTTTPDMAGSGVAAPPTMTP